MTRIIPLLLAPWLVVAGCDCSEAASGPCGGDSPLPGCGEPCETRAECPSGLYCSGGVCTADCARSGDACPAGRSCGDEGRCVTGPDDGSADTAPSDGNQPDNVCASVEVGVDVQIPNVVVIVDQSGSMDDDFNGRSRWDTLRESLLDPTSFITRRQSAIRFGLALFSEQNRSAMMCPDIFFEPPDLDNYSDIERMWRAHEPGGGTPTGESVDAIRAMLPASISMGDDPTIFVLATDGEPDTCANGDDFVNGRRLSLAAIEGAFGVGIETFVISVDTGVAASHLQDIANAGVGRAPGGPDAEFWVVTDTAGLEAAFDRIIGGIGSCDVTLDGMLDVTRACEGTVTLDDVPLGCDDPDGWRATDESHIEVMGEACDRFLEGRVLEATFPCGVVLI